MDTASALSDPAQTNPYWRGNSYALFFGCLCSSLGFSCSWPFLPIILKELGVTHGLAAWVGYLVGAFFGMSFLLTPVWAGLADHYGKRTLMLRAGFGMGAGFCLLPLFPNVWAFLVLFMLIGAANGYIPGALAMTAANTPVSHAGRALAIVQMGSLVGSACGPALGAVLFALLPPVSVFWAASALTVMAGVIALFFTREDVVRPTVPFRFTVLHDLKACLRVPGMPILYAVNCIFVMTYQGSTTVVSLFDLELMADAPLFLGQGIAFWIGAATLAMTLASMVAAYAWGRFMDRYHLPHVLAVSLLVSFLGSLALPASLDPLHVVGARALLGALMVGMQPAVLRLVKDLAPGGMAVRAIGFAAALQMLGNGSAPLTAGWLAPTVGLRGYFVLNSLLVLLMLILWVLRGPGVSLTLGRWGFWRRAAER
jgi:MFS transporter, DHA1 family, multidrug resistance protein